MANTTLPAFTGVTFNNVRKALYLMYFGTEGCDDFSSPRYKYILPMQGNFENPSQKATATDTFMLYWIERDESLTQDDFVYDGEQSYNRQKCVATILVRFIGAQAEDWVKSFRHLTKRSGVTDIWAGVCNAEKLEFTAPIIPYRIDYFGLNNNIVFDVHFKLYYDECISTGWKPLTEVDFKAEGDIHVEDNSN